MPTLLNAGKTLVVLDNFETIWAGAFVNEDFQQILDILASVPLLSVIITMRGNSAPPINSGKYIKELPPNTLQSLSDTAAREMYFGLAKKQPTAYSAKNLNNLNMLLKEIDYIPLAISLVAALDKQYNPTQLYDRWLKSQTKLLTRPGITPRKNTNIELSINLSLNSNAMVLCPEAMRLLNLLCFLP